MKKTITLGISGAIGASNMYNYCIFLLDKYNLNIVMTENAKKFVSKDILQNYVKNVYSDFEDCLTQVLHAEIAKTTDLFIIIPATANTISKIANGIADNLLTTTAVIYNKKILFAPNMNVNMWKNPILQNNVNILKGFGHSFINTTKMSYAVCDKKFMEIDCALPNPKELLAVIEEYFSRENKNENED